MAVVLKRTFTVSVTVDGNDPLLMDLGAEVNEPVFVIVRQGKEDLLLVEMQSDSVHPVLVEVKPKPDDVTSPNNTDSPEKSLGQESQECLDRSTPNNDQISIDENNCDEAFADSSLNNCGKNETNSVANNTTEKAYACEHCDKSFVELSDLKLHSISHTDEKRQVCSTCGERFTTYACLSRHMRSHRQKKQFKCGECGVDFPSRRKLVQHTKTHNEVKEVNTKPEPDCKPIHSVSVRDLMDRFNKPEPLSLDEDRKSKLTAAFTDELERVEHNSGESSTFFAETIKKSDRIAGLLHSESVDENESLYKAFDCDDSVMENGESEITAERTNPESNDLNVYSSSRDGQNLQTPSASKEEVHVCPICGEQLTSHALLLQHIQIHRPNRARKTKSEKRKRYECTYCEEVFVYHRELTKHVRTHTGNPYQCAICGKENKDRCQLRAHMLKHSKERPFKCTVCEEAFRDKKLLMAHMRIHTGEKLLCSECGEECRTDWQLECHKNSVHNKDNPHKCNQCGKVFPHPNLLDSHMDVHVVEKSYQCSECGKLFTRRGDLRSHMWSHSDVKPYPCPMCDKSYARQQQLTRHLPSHNGKPYKCTHCGKSFHRESTLRDHETLHTGNKQYRCDECGKTFAYSQSLHAHKMMHRGGGPYVCEHCGKEYSLDVYRRRHIREVHFDIEEESSKNA